MQRSVWQADTASMNPTVDPRVIAEAYAQDEASAAAEYGAQFRRDVESFIAREAIEACVVTGRHELAPLSTVPYVGFVDPSGGNSDSMTLAVAHAEERDGQRVAVLAKASFERWLAPDNFDAEGRQKMNLNALNSLAAC